MPFIPFPTGSMESTILYEWNGVPVINTMGWRTNDESAADVSDGTNISDNIASWLTSSVLPNVCSSLICLSVKTVDLTSATGWTWTTDVGVAGGVSTESVPNNCALVVTLETGLRGRSFRGRNFFPGLPLADLDSPLEWKITTVAGFTSFYETLDSDQAAAGYAMEVLSRFSGGAPRAIGVPTPVIAIQAKVPVYTQRGRLT